MNWQTVGNETFKLGESPFWHPQEQALYWVDIPGKKVMRANVDMGTTEPGCIAPAQSGGFVIALRTAYSERPTGGCVAKIDHLAL